jgi:vancomycin resistance protein YoaR
MADSTRPSSAVLLGVGGLLVAGAAILGGIYLWGARSEAATSVPPPAAVRAPAAVKDGPGRELLARKVTLRVDKTSQDTTWDAVGLDIDASGGLTWNVAKALDVLVALRDQHGRPPVSARVDLEKREVIPEQSGYAIDVYASLAALDDAARAGRSEVALVAGEIEAPITRAKLGNLEVSHVLGWFETHYPPVEKDRNYNLRLVAEHVNGRILMPGQTFSFNDVVGDRTEKQGYRVAHVIQAGEMVDGLAGGACQISSTLHGAAWFAGLDIVNSSPHSRPSAYITMGLDATVVYPSVDLKLRNPYPFPVVIHYVVSQGTVRVEILGAARPWDKIAFERELKKEIPFETVSRDDDDLPLGTQIIDQMGFPGYELVRRRIFYKGGKAVKTEKWDIKYPSTTEYVRLGANPDPNLVAPKQPDLHGPMSPGKDTYVLAQ